ncbi:ubiquitin carboxyl-terminal hydrolase CYLD isoform X4 [Dermacentor albipictus]|uniref:ubiquitin carboxyl-terminal hydrolase CYLD isoform X4 n=1 Tax=Dermacentor albipictus TaxID=60249 RepID=UPI0031FC5288
MNRTTQSHKPKVLLDRDIQNPRFDAGTLFEVLADDPYESKVKVQSLDPGDSGVILCNREILREVTSLEALVLLPVKPVRNRLKIYRDQEWLKEIPVISENKRVVVKDKFEGIVKFKGVVREYGPGIRFIVEIQDGTNDPIKRKQCFSIQDLRLLEGRENYHGHNSVVPRLPSKKKSLSSGITRCDPAPWHQERLRDFCEPESSPLRIDDRVVWVSDHGPEYGTVRWLGHLHDTSEDLMDNQVGTGTGKYRDRQLFEAQLGHASLIPLLGLLKADDYLGEQAPVDYGNSCFYTSHIDRRLKFPPSSHFQDFAEDKPKHGGISRGPSQTTSDAVNHVNPLYEKCQALNNQTEPKAPGDCPPHLDKGNSTNRRCVDRLGLTEDAVAELCKVKRGIQGHHNSCYLDATLFAMFSCTYIFDDILNRERQLDDIEEYDCIQKVLRDDIVNTLRRDLYVPSENVMRLRELLDSLGCVSGLTTEEKDPEEFLNSLFHALKVQPFLKLSSQQETHLYQLFVAKNEQLEIPTVQQLFHQSIHESKLKLKEIPKALIIQMPRCGKQFKLYDHIVPSLKLDITDALENSPRFCYVCGRQATQECWNCFRPDVGLECTSYCDSCNKTVHQHQDREGHKQTALSNDCFGEDAQPRRQVMTLFAVVCIETSHYVCFVKCPVEDGKHTHTWCFFDSMADREGGEDGHNIPKVDNYMEADTWFGPKGLEKLRDMARPDKSKILPGMTRRLLCDAYLCMYEDEFAKKYK